MFVDRTDAGLQLADALKAFHGKDAVLLAIPRGGVHVAAEVARALHLPMDILLTKKIGHPNQPELAIGAVSLQGLRIDPSFHVPRAYIDAEAERIRGVLRERESSYRSGRPPLTVRGRTAIIVDDGIATGSTVRAAIELMRQAGAKRVVVAVPVAAVQTVEQLQELADEVVCAETPDDLYAIGAHYEDFAQTSDAEVIALLDKAARREARTGQRK
ncbi:MAG: phosphoribosyltransferase family protein [Flavobacteriales bacterium]|jgi:predicted phosphoribosyltransferase|nr:MAG: phosphoribosyltransferase family protein [Flavobacteriales bacterium]